MSGYLDDFFDISVLILVLGACDSPDAVLHFEFLLHTLPLILLFLDKEVHECVILVTVAVVEDLLEPILSHLLPDAFLIGTIDSSPGILGLQL